MYLQFKHGLNCILFFIPIFHGLNCRYYNLNHDVVPTREDLSIDVSITNLGLILTKLRLFHLFGTGQNSISNF